MQIKIMGRRKLDAYLPTTSPVNVVFITEPTEEVLESVKTHAKDYTVAKFYDVTFPIASRLPPTKEDVVKILEWTKDKEEPFVVSCAAGVSRSSAIAYLVAYQKSNSVDEALSVLDPNIHEPNSLIVKYGSELLSCEDIYTRYLQWRNDALDAANLELQL